MRPLLLRTAFFLSCLLLTQCFRPPLHFEHYTPPRNPDYALEKNWAALPAKKDSADVVPLHSALHDEQATAKVDVFFIHPTVYFKGKSWNADIDDPAVRKLVDKYPIREQASVFNGSCKVYAPYYRQATLASFTDRSGSGRKALDTAYADVLRAFRYYLAHYNNGRPFIIAGHSQGSFLAQRLLAEVIDKEALLSKRLVAAYLVGGIASPDLFTTIVPCDSAKQCGCYVAWHTRRWDSEFEYNPKKDASKPGYDNCTNYECVNPLTWRRDTAYAPASFNKGSVPASFDRVDEGLVDAQRTGQRILWVHKPAAEGYLNRKNYHVLDYNLFYMNIRENVQERIDAYFRKGN